MKQQNPSNSRGFVYVIFTYQSILHEFGYAERIARFPVTSSTVYPCCYIVPCAAHLPEGLSVAPYSALESVLRLYQARTY